MTFLGYIHENMASYVGALDFPLYPFVFDVSFVELVFASDRN